MLQLNSIRHWSYYQFHWYASSSSKTLPTIWHFYSVNHLFLIWCYRHRDSPFVFNIWWHCVASLFNMVACYSPSLLWQVVFCSCRKLVWALLQDFCMWGRHLQRKFQESPYMCTEILYLHGWLAITDVKSKTNGWLVKKELNTNNKQPHWMNRIHSGCIIFWHSKLAFL